MGILLQPNFGTAAGNVADEITPGSYVTNRDGAAIVRQYVPIDRDIDVARVQIRVSNLNPVTRLHVADRIAIEAGSCVAEGVRTGASGKRVRARSAGDDIVARTTVYRVIAAAAVDLVISVKTKNRIVA